MLDTKIETERIIISYGQIEDYIKVHEFDFNYLEDIDGEFKYIKKSPKEVRSWFSNDSSIEEHYKRLEEKKIYDFIVYLKDKLEPIGNICFNRYNKENNSLEIACYIHPKYWGNGYAKEALISIMDYIYSLGFDNIVYGYEEENYKSKVLSEKIGFKPYKQLQVDTFLGNKTIGYIKIMSKEDYYNLYKNK